MLELVLKVCGSLFLVKQFLYWSVQLYRGINTFVLPRLVNNQGDLKSRFGQWALVTGCTGGIGREYAVQLARKGMDMILVSRSRDKLDMLAKEIEQETGVKTLIVVADMTNTDVLPDIVSQVEGLDLGVLVNNVGMSPGEYVMPFLENERKELADVITVNCTVATYLCHAFLPSMKKKGKGAIINISSIARIAEFPFLAVYCATKHFIHAFTKSIEMESYGSGVIIQEVNPGVVRTEMTKYVDDERQSASTFPKADTFVKSALATLGHSSRTSGWWNHSLSSTIVMMIPEVIRDYVFLKSGEQFYKDALSLKEKEKQQ